MQGLKRNGFNEKDLADRFNRRRKGRDFGLSRGLGRGICRNRQHDTCEGCREGHKAGGMNRFFPIIRHSHSPDKNKTEKKTREISFKEKNLKDQNHQNERPTLESLVSRLKVMRALLKKKSAKTPKPVAIALSEKCMGCGLCVAICPEHAISMSEKKNAMIESDKCAACGFCVDQCPQEAISLYKMIS